MRDLLLVRDCENSMTALEDLCAALLAFALLCGAGWLALGSGGHPVGVVQMVERGE